MTLFIGIALLIALGIVIFMIAKESTEKNDCLEGYEDMKGIKFVMRNSPNYANTKRHIENLCDCYNVKDYEFQPFIDDQIALWVMINSTQHIVYLDHESLEIKVSIGGNIVRIFGGDSGWRMAIQYLSEKADNN